MVAFIVVPRDVICRVELVIKEKTYRDLNCAPQPSLQICTKIFSLNSPRYLFFTKSITLLTQEKAAIREWSGASDVIVTFSLTNSPILQVLYGLKL